MYNTNFYIIKKIIIFFIIPLLGVACIIIPYQKSYAFPGNYYWFPANTHVRIRHPSSGLYLGIDRNGSGKDGARVQLQKYEESNQNQIFYLKAIKKDENGRYQYQIRVHGENNMILEIRNSSHDDYAEAAQWTEHDGDCSRWYFFVENEVQSGTTNKVTCCIKNVESGKLLNVLGNEGYDGNNLIQYHEDGTQAEVFEIIHVKKQKTSAIWSRDWSNATDLYWTITKNTKKNRKKYYTPINIYGEEYFKHPIVYSKDKKFYLASVIWADPSLQTKILQTHNQPKNGWSKLADSIKSVGSDSAIDVVFSKTPLGSIPTSGILGIVGTIMAGQQENQWYIIEKAIQEHSYIRIEVYYVFESGTGWTNCVAYVNDTVNHYWDGDFSSVTDTVEDYYGNMIKGTVEYLYK